VAAFRAAEEPHFALIGSPELAQPPDCKVILALGALDLDRGHGIDLVIFIIHDRNFVFRAFPLFFHDIIAIDLPDISALAAFELPSGRHH
jgi:hypothetical protein